jgi:hypothetical protein
VVEQNNEELGIWSLCLYAMKSPLTRVKYIGRLEKFFDFLKLGGSTVEEKSKSFIKKVKTEGNQWVFNIILRFMQFHMDRVVIKEITDATVRNYLKSINLFCEMADIPIAWKKMSRGLPRGKNYADDRILTNEEIQKILSILTEELKPLCIL